MNNFNEAIRWSRLARFGKSNLARLTIVAPFLGFLVFLNTGLENYILLGPVELSEGWLKYLADRRVEILYIGLSLLGAATGIFSLIAPDTIKSSEQYSDFIQFKESTKTDNAVIGSFEETIEACETRRIEVVESFHDIPETWNFPAKIKSSIYRLIIEVFKKVKIGLTIIQLRKLKTKAPMRQASTCSMGFLISTQFLTVWRINAGWSLQFGNRFLQHLLIFPSMFFVLST
ncbi:hypothetical protein K3757_16450 [Sulfitobacter sp. S223]|uniref:hypothetical protein n=1 Tax=Sulfitobacter sp. S223 TaxID=2867023 RepID=UPI0021A8F3F1|nr:hypothetical protein [Sulfitobacter sp. S223]UWR26020.1 hypothetical protein K3757_16450 [Sulfitobacter sp. S223]